MKKNMFLHVLNKKKEFILSSEIKCPKSGIFTNNYWVGWVGQSNSASKHSSFVGRCRKIFRAKMAQPPPRKNWPVRLWSWPPAYIGDPMVYRLYLSTVGVGVSVDELDQPGRWLTRDEHDHDQDHHQSHCTLVLTGPRPWPWPAGTLQVLYIVLDPPSPDGSLTLTLTRWNIAGCLRQLSVSLLARWSAGSDCADAWQHGILGSVSSSWKWGWLAAGRSTARSTSRQRRWCGRRRLNQAVFGSTSAPRLLRGRWSSARKIWRT